jgi:hypothetical protein
MPASYSSGMRIFFLFTYVYQNGVGTVKAGDTLEEIQPKKTSRVSEK